MPQDRNLGGDFQRQRAVSFPVAFNFHSVWELTSNMPGNNVVFGIV